MALINCPECGSKVSSNTTQCVHCGCTYTVCPECGKVYVGKVQICLECGFSISPIKTTRALNDKNSNSDSVTDINEAWQSRSFTDKIVMKVTKIVSIILFLVVLALTIFAYIVIDMWDGSLESILKTNDILNKSHNLIIVACIIGVLIVIVSEFEEVYMHIMCGEWIRKNKIDVMPYLKKLKNEVEMEELPTYWNFENFSSATYLSVVPHDKGIRIAKYIIIVMIAVLIAITGGVCLTQNVDEFLRYKMFEDAFDFKYAALIAAAVFIALYFVVNIIFGKIFNKRKEAWLQSL